MVQPFTGFITKDGSKFACEADAHKDEIQKAISIKFPGMKASIIHDIIANVEWFASLLSPLAPKPINHPETLDKPPLSLVADDPCSKGGNHDWVNQSNAGSLCYLIDECSKCQEGRA